MARDRKPDDRTYIKLHDGMPDHPKVADLTDTAFRLLIEMWCYCSRHLTDGRVPRSVAERRGPDVLTELLNTGLVVSKPGGWVMHDYLNHQRSAQEVAEAKERAKLNGSKGGKARAEALARQTAKQTANQPAKQTAKRNAGNPVSKGSSKIQAETETETYLPTEPNGSVAAGNDLVISDGSTDNAGALVGEWIDHCKTRPPGRVIGQVSKLVKELIDEGVPVGEVRRGMATWHQKGLHPSTLPSVVNEVMNGGGKPSTTDQRVASALELAEQYRQRGE